MSLGIVIKKERISKGFKQKELADALGISSNYLSLIENDKREPRLCFLRELAKALGIPTSSLLVEFDDTPTIDSDPTQTLKRINELVVELQHLQSLYYASIE